MYIYGICYRIRLENQIVRILKQTQELMNYKQLKIHSSYTLDWYINFCLRFGEYAYEKNCNNFFSSNSTRIYNWWNKNVAIFVLLKYLPSEWKYGIYIFFFANDIARAARKKKKTIKVFDKTYQRTTRANVSYLTVASCVHFLGHSFLFENETETFCSRSKDSSLSRILSPIFSFYIHRVK